MNNKTVQQRLCTQPKDEPEDALRFAVAFEERISHLSSCKAKPENAVIAEALATFRACAKSQKPLDSEDLRSSEKRLLVE